MKRRNWQCPKCDQHEYEVGQFAATSGTILSRMFNFQSRKFSTITCKKCQFTEIYKTTSGKLVTFLDIFSGG